MTDRHWDICVQADRRAQARHVYRAEMTDIWLNYADYIEANPDRLWSGDCEDLAMTARELAARNGAPHNRLFLALVNTRGDKDGPADHAFAMYLDDDDVWHIFGDTFGSPRPLSHSNHAVLMTNCLADGVGFCPWGQVANPESGPLSAVVSQFES